MFVLVFNHRYLDAQISPDLDVLFFSSSTKIERKKNNGLLFYVICSLIIMCLSGAKKFVRKQVIKRHHTECHQKAVKENNNNRKRRSHSLDYSFAVGSVVCLCCMLTPILPIFSAKNKNTLTFSSYVFRNVYVDSVSAAWKMMIYCFNHVFILWCHRLCTLFFCLLFNFTKTTTKKKQKKPPEKKVKKTKHAVYNSWEMVTKQKSRKKGTLHKEEPKQKHTNGVIKALKQWQR